MNITGGQYKGHKIYTLKTDVVRPTSSKVRASIFDVLKGLLGNFEEIKMLDLFAGSGIMGIEGLSRSFKEIFFIDKNPKSIKIIKENLSKYRNNFTVINQDAFKFLGTYKNQFDLIFIDPPYFENLYPKILEKISKNNILSKDGIIVIERDVNIDINKEIEANSFNLIKTKKYGNTCIDYLIVKL
ncbi:MAG: 16S rRNA (guanine(966)-N(2))-methyltransferase RsmD [Candidatus Gastranaerophilales bacterium]|nr:16S rRNA (guanine(966)-N(2))-methyltransferase RsmD [Candidatus Gastranaerophilales bacterium]